MPRDLRAYLWDIERAASAIETFTHGKELSDYQQDAMLRAAVERCCEIIGESLAQALRFFPEIGPRIANAQQIIAFRNRLIHGYATVKDSLVWEILHTHLSSLRRQAAELLREIDQKQD